MSSVISDLLYPMIAKSEGDLCTSSAYQLQLINFLLRKGERELAHQAIEAPSLPQAWRLSRDAETALAFREYGIRGGMLFLQGPSARYDREHDLAAARQRALSHSGRLVQVGSRIRRMAISCAAGSEQTVEISGGVDGAASRLGRRAGWLWQCPLSREEGHCGRYRTFSIAYELDPNDTVVASDLGAAYFIAGDRKNAEEMWHRALDGAIAGQMSSVLLIRCRILDCRKRHGR